VLPYTIIDTREKAAACFKELESATVLSVDTETVGVESFKYFTQAATVAKTWPCYGRLPFELFFEEIMEGEHQGCFEFQDSPVPRLKQLYKKQYKGRDRRVGDYIRSVEAKRDRRDSLVNKLLTKATKHPGGLHFWENYLGMIQLATTEHAYLIRPQILDAELCAALGSLLNNAPLILLQNCQFDWKMFKQHTGVELHCKNLHDTRIAEVLLKNGKFDANWQPYRSDLKSIAERRLQEFIPGGVELSKDKAVRVSNWLGEWTEDMIHYAVRDVEFMFEIARQQHEELNERRTAGSITKSLQETMDLECLLVPVTAAMEMEGLGVDLDYLDDLKKRLELEVAAEEIKVKEILGVANPNSTAQVLAALIGAGIHVKDTNKKTLQRHRKKPEVAALLDYRKVYKLLNTYLRPFSELGVQSTEGYRIYANFNANGTESGRYSSSNPNLQNLPATPEYRRIVVPKRDHVFINADTSQIELRILAEISRDPVLLAAFAAGDDVHKIAASLVFGVEPGDVTKEQRNKCKTVGFGIIYGLSEYGLAEQLGIDEMAARDLIDRYFMNFYKVKRWIEETKEQIKRDGYALTLGGRVRYFPDVFSSDPKKVQAALRAAINHIIQGTAADGLKQSLLLLYPELKKVNASLVGCFHDEVLVEFMLNGVKRRDEGGQLIEDLYQNEQCVQLQSIVKDFIIKGYTTYIKSVIIKIGSEENNYEPLIVTDWGQAK
jgi:DNA polymerase I-like protein with 3'-5' exonuclease and polymerase domains